jgi:hypothetical protein
VRAPWRTSAPITPGGKEPVDTSIRDPAARAEVAGLDETGVRATGSLHWLHTVWTNYRLAKILFFCLHSQGGGIYYSPVNYGSYGGAT